MLTEQNTGITEISNHNSQYNETTQLHIIGLSVVTPLIGYRHTIREIVKTLNR